MIENKKDEKEVKDITITLTFTDGTKKIHKNPKDMIFFSGKFKTDKNGLLNEVENNYEIIRGKGINVLTLLGGIIKEIVNMAGLRPVMQVISFAISKTDKGNLIVLDRDDLKPTLNLLDVKDKKMEGIA